MIKDEKMTDGEKVKLKINLKESKLSKEQQARVMI